MVSARASHGWQLLVGACVITAATAGCGRTVLVSGRSDAATARPAPHVPTFTIAPSLRGQRLRPVLVGAVDPATGMGVAGPLGPPWPAHFTAADAVVARVALYQSPGKLVPTGVTLPNPTVEGLPLVFLVRRTTAKWLQVQIQSRPNGATVWIKRSDVATRRVPNHILIERRARRITVFHGSRKVSQDVAAVGKATSPTPLGTFYVDGIAKPPNPNGLYGAYQISFTGFSDVYQRFGAGIGQVALHGTNQPALLGTPASHGCVRLSNESITRLVALAPSGTPVEVVP